MSVMFSMWPVNVSHVVWHQKSGDSWSLTWAASVSVTQLLIILLLHVVNTRWDELLSGGWSNRIHTQNPSACQVTTGSPGLVSMETGRGARGEIGRFGAGGVSPEFDWQVQCCQLCVCSQCPSTSVIYPECASLCVRVCVCVCVCLSYTTS